jgi:hypothetical protein
LAADGAVEIQGVLPVMVWPLADRAVTNPIKTIVCQTSLATPILSGGKVVAQYDRFGGSHASFGFGRCVA